MLGVKTKKFRSKAYRKWIASLPCLITKVHGTQAAHIRAGTNGGMGLKPEDNWCVPLSPEMHDLQHKIGERKFWDMYGGIEKAKNVANLLYQAWQEDEHERDNTVYLIIARF